MMKKATFFFLVIATLTTTFYSCKTNTDDLWDSIHQLDERVTSLEELCKQMNGNISSLQKLVQALQDNNSITKVTPIKEGEKVIGYTISFTKGEPITIYHGEKGEQGDKGDDGTTPVITVDQDGETYYWKVNGEWLTDKKGNKIPTTGEDGQDAVSPQLEIRNGRWFLFNGETWTDIGQATGDAGKDGDSFFESVEEKEGYVEFTLPSGTVLTIPKNTLSIVKGIKSVSYIPRYDDGKASVSGTSKADSYIELDFEISPKESADLLVKYDGVVSVQGIYTTIRTRAIDFIQFPVLSISAENGILSLKVSGENLDDAFFAGTQGAQLALKLEDSESTYASDYIGIVPSLPTYTFTATYQTTSPNQTIKIAHDIDAYPIAGAANRLISIDYGDGTNGTSSTHTYAAQGEHTVTFSFVNEVTEIGEHAFKECSQLTGIEYPKNITKISDKAFHKTGIIDIIIPNTVTHIGKSAFEECINVKRINVPNSIKNLGSRAFAYRTTGELYIDCDIPSYQFGGINDTSFYWESVFYWNNITKIVIGKNVKSIGDWAFTNCNQVRTIDYEDGTQLENIGYGAFQCPLVEEMPIPRSVKTMGDYPFALCSSLKGFKMVGSGNGNYIVRNDMLCVNLGGTIIRCPPLKEGSYCDIRGAKGIAKGAFRDCINLEEIAVNSGSEPMIIEEGAFYGCKNLVTVTGFESTNPTLDLTFHGCEKLTSIELPTTVEEIGYEAFWGCKSLTGDLVIPDNVKTIGISAYEGCAGFKGKLIIPNTVETIGHGAFKGCVGVLKGGELYLGKGLKQIDDRAFDAGSDENVPSSFRKIYCSATVPPIINYSDLNCEQLIVPKGCLEAYQNSNWNSVSGNIIEED
ncbi:leucine-rich repeat protein [Bacteroides acidifaciens]|uniref:leucine-rich repeat protein n=1 Tax=Bacteroides acidifaciens TaxID=85831 RepID=UPI0025581887|nr:leucine-rich repeat protein [Bacteroides acidifaciens]